MDEGGHLGFGVSAVMGGGVRLCIQLDDILKG